MTSEAINNLTPGAELFYRRLMSKADDFGRYDGRAAILLGELYALKLEKGEVSIDDVKTWIAECVAQKVISVYESDGKRCIVIHKFDQQVRAKKSKWPNPLTDDNGCSHMNEDAHLGAGADEGADEGAGDGGGGQDVLARIGVAEKTARTFNGVSPDYVLRHWLTIEDAKRPVGVLVSRLRAGERPRPMTAAEIAGACAARDGPVRSIAVDGVAYGVEGVKYNGGGLVIGGKVVSPDKVILG